MSVNVTVNAWYGCLSVCGIRCGGVIIDYRKPIMLTPNTIHHVMIQTNTIDILTMNTIIPSSDNNYHHPDGEAHTDQNQH